MATTTEPELLKLLSSALEAASKAGGGDAAEEGRAVDALKALGKLVVTSELLGKTSAGKKAKKLTKHTSELIKAAASATVQAWMDCVRQEQKNKSAEPAAEPAEPSAFDSQPSASEKATASASVVLESQDSLSTGISGAASGMKRASTKPARCGDNTRDKIRDLLADALCMVADTDADTAAIAVQIEEAMFRQNGEVNQKYKAKYRTLGFNLKDPNNPDLRKKVVSGDIPPDILVNLSADELGSDERRQNNDKIREHMKNEAVRGQNQQASTDMFQCSKCRQRKCTYYQMQTRSADEPMTTFVTCVNCGNRWKFC